MSSEFIPEPTKEVKVIPKELQDKMGAIEACATAFNVLDKGYFPHSYGNAVKASLGFLKLLHEQSIEEALAHPQAHMVPELKEAMKKKEEINGEETKAN